jgi:nucleotide-binding universal stress UspA family protein
VDDRALMAIARETREAALLTQRDRTHPGIKEWPFTVDVGERVDAILAHAVSRNASLILLGLGAHGVGARLRQRETALRVIRAAGKPVLAVPSDAWGVPHSVLAAIDFTASSELAAKAAVELLGGEGTLYLAHVTPRVPIPQGDPRTWGEITTTAVLPKLEAVGRRLDVPPGLHVEYVLLHGDPAHELNAFADERHVDLIAAGTHGRSALGRLVLGSVSTKLVRTATCGVLVAPPHPDADVSAEPAAPNDVV